MKRLLILILLLGAIAALVKLASHNKQKWTGLSEAEVRDRLDARLPDRIPDEKRAEVADKVVSKMRDKGMLSEELEDVSPAADDVDEAEEDAATAG